MAVSGDLNLRYLFRQMSLTFGRQVFAVLCQLGLVVLLARALGPQGFGQFSIAILLSMLLAALLNLGIPAANVFFIARGGVPMATALTINLRLWLVLAILGLVGSAALLLGFSETLFPGVPQSLLWGATVLFPINLLYMLLASLLLGRQDFKRYNAALVLPAVVSLLAAAGLVWGLGLGVAAALVSWGLGQFAGLFALAWFIRPYWGHMDEAEEISLGYARRCLGYGWKAHTSNLMTFLNYRADIFLVNLFIGPAGAGVYVVAVQIAEQLWLLSQAVSTVLLPRLSELHTDESARRRLTPLVARWVTYSGLLLAVALALISKPLVGLLFGPEYGEAVLALVWLLPGIVVFNCARVLANDVAARGRPELNIWTAGITLIVNLIGNILLIPRYGIIGAALATTIAYAVTTVGSFAFYAHLSRNPWWRPLVFEPEDWRLLGRVMALLNLKRGTASQ